METNIRKEWDKLLLEWENSYCHFSAYQNFMTPAWEKLYNFHLQYPIETLGFIEEELKKEPTNLVYLLSGYINVEGFVPLDKECNFWLNFINGTKDIDYYKEWRENLHGPQGY